MKAFTIKLNAGRYDVKPLNGMHRFKVNVDGNDVYFEADMDGYLRPETAPREGLKMSLLLDLAERIQQSAG
jgi:hypothetical protein